MSRNGSDHIVPIDSKRKKRGGGDRTVISAPKPQGFGHLLPAKIPRRDERVPLANVPRCSIGRGYVLEMARRFPRDCLLTVDWEHHRLSELGIEPFEAEHMADMSLFELPHAGPTYPRLKVRVDVRGEDLVEVANIIADPFGADLFAKLVHEHRELDFHHSDFGQLPLKAVDLASIRRLNGLPG